MAVINIQNEVDKQYQSLSDRLNALDQYQAQSKPQVKGKILDFSNMIVGDDPMDRVKAAMNYDVLSGDVRSGLSKQQQGILDAMIRMSESEKDRALEERRLAMSSQKNSGDDFLGELKKAAALEEIKSGKLKLNMKTGELESTVPEGQKAAIQDRDTIRGLAEELLGTDTNPITGQIQIAKQLGIPYAKDLQATLDQLVSLLQLESRQKLKGQGAITDKEMAMLGKSVAGIQPGISDTKLKKELQIIINNLGGASSGGANTGLDDLDERLIQKYRKKGK